MDASVSGSVHGPLNVPQRVMPERPGSFMAITTNGDLFDVLKSHRLLDGPELDELTRLARIVNEPRSLARQAVARNWLTPFQVNQLFLDRASELVLGQYLLLERLGEGAMGQVFKVRHRLLHWIAALKVIRRRYVSNDDVVRRFCQEIQAMARLSHPNVIYEFDAGCVADTYFIVMEYVEGTDLSRLVRERGALPWSRALNYVYQAALGLQHAYERGMIHRDIKPSNLLLTRARAPGQNGSNGTSGWLLPPAARAAGGHGEIVKIFDMGLSRLLAPPDGDDSSPTLTRANVFIGTPDYVAPEQAQTPHAADIRSDLYSLGCTFYFLLAGRVPFPGGTPLDKLIHHCHSQATPLEQLRPDMPPGLAAIVRRLMAKAPAERYRAPSSLLKDLTPYLAAEAFAVPPDLEDVPMALPVEESDSRESSQKFFADCFNLNPGDERIIKLRGTPFAERTA
jgi:serine/threonine protein kinase